MALTTSPLLEDARQLWAAKSLLKVLTQRELIARNAGTAAGLFWAYAQPVLLVAAYYLVFDVVFAMRLAENAPTHRVGAFLIVGALPWMAFCDAISRGMNSLIDAAGLLQKNPLPPVLFVARAVLASTAVHGPLMMILAVIYAITHGIGLAWLSLPVVMLLHLAVTLVLAYLLAVMTAAVRDTSQVVAFMLSVGIFLSPVLFPIHMFPQNWQWVLYLNPFTAFVLAYQTIFLQTHWPTPTIWLVMGLWLLAVTGALDYALRRSREQLIDWL